MSRDASADLAGWVLLGASLVMVLVAFHVILLRRTQVAMGEPLAWVVASGLLFFAAVAWAHRAARPAATRLQRALRLDPADVVVALLFFVLLAAFGMGFSRATGDGREYFVQVRSLIMDHDLQFQNEIDHFRTSGVTWVMPPGTGVFWIPFYVAAHVWLSVLGLAGVEVQLDGYWNPYQQAVGLGTLILGYGGVVLLYRMLRRRYPGWNAALTTWALVGGTFLFYYLTVEATYAHGVAFFVVVLFIGLWQRMPAPRNARQQALLGVVGGLMTAVRWENALFLALPATEEVPALVGALRRRRWEGLRPLLALIGAGVVGFVPQLAIWGIYQQTYLTTPEMAAEQWWGNPLFAEVLFSSNRGLMAWHPVFLFAIAGLPLAWKRDKRLIAVLSAVLVGLLWANAASAWWAGGAGFGYRRLAVLVPICAFGLAALVDAAVRRPRVLVAVVVAPLILLNLAMTAAAVGGTLPVGEGVTFDRLVMTLYERTGNPFALPISAWYRLRYGMAPAQYDRLGLRMYNNLDIGLGRPGDDRFLISGWGVQEQDESGESFRWVTARRALFAAPLKERLETGARHPLPDYELRLTIQPFAVPDEQQTLEVIVNGRAVGRQALEPGLHEITIAVPGDMLARNLNFFELQFGYARSPAELGNADDPRTLAARLTRIFLWRTAS